MVPDLHAWLTARIELLSSMRKLQTVKLDAIQLATQCT